MMPNKLITGGTSSWPVEPSKVLYYPPIDKTEACTTVKTMNGHRKVNRSFRLSHNDVAAANK